MSTWSAMVLWWLPGCADPVDPDRAVLLEPCAQPGVICPWVGVVGVPLFDAASGTDRSKTHVYLPIDLAFADDGTAYYLDYNNKRIRKVDPGGLVSTVSGTGFPGDGVPYEDCWEGCDAATFGWRNPADVAVRTTERGHELVAVDWRTNRVVVLEVEAGTARYLAGDGVTLFAEGVDPATGEPSLASAGFDAPTGVAVDPSGAVWVADSGNHVLRRIDEDRLEERVEAGSPRQPGYEGDGGLAATALFHGDIDGARIGSKIALAGATLYVADSVNGVIRALDLDTGRIERVAGRYTSAGTSSWAPDPASGELVEIDAGSIPGYSGDGGDALDAVFSFPADVAVGAEGELYVADLGNTCVRVVRDGLVHTFAGTCGESGYAGEAGPADEAVLGYVAGVATDPEGNGYVADAVNQVILRVKR